MSISGGSFGEQRVAGFLEGLAQKGVDIKDLAPRIRNPIDMLKSIAIGIVLIAKAVG